MRQEIRCNLTLIPQSGMRNEAAVLGRLKLAATLGIQFLDINSLPLCIHALPLQHAFVSPHSLYSIVTRHLMFQVSKPLRPGRRDAKGDAMCTACCILVICLQVI